MKRNSMFALQVHEMLPTIHAHIKKILGVWNTYVCKYKHTYIYTQMYI